MTISGLGNIFKKVYKTVPQGYQVANIYLFGFKYASEIISNRYKISEIIKASGLNSSYATEVSKGVKLSKYVKR